LRYPRVLLSAESGTVNRPRPKQRGISGESYWPNYRYGTVLTWQVAVLSSQSSIVGITQL